MSEITHPAIQRVVDAGRAAGVALDVRVFDSSTHTAEDAAQTLGVDVGQIVKSLVFVAPRADGAVSPVLCLVSGRNRVDLGRLAEAIGEPQVRRATAREARELTGASIGGIPPIGHLQPIRVVFDPDLAGYPIVWAAAGTDTAVFPIAPEVLRTLSNASVAPIAAPPTDAAQPGESS